MSAEAPDYLPRALVVDDEAAVRMDVGFILEDAGYIVYQATSGDNAIIVLEQHHRLIRLLVTDVMMPGQRDGFALAREVALRWPSINIVVVSERAMPEAGDLPVGATFIGKPLSPAIVEAHLRQQAAS